MKYILNILWVGENIFREGKKRRQVLAVENILKYWEIFWQKMKNWKIFRNLLKYILNILGLEEDISWDGKKWPSSLSSWKSTEWSSVWLHFQFWWRFYFEIVFFIWNCILLKKSEIKDLWHNGSPQFPPIPPHHPPQ